MYTMSSYLFVLVNDTATTVIYTYGHTLSLHDALPISRCVSSPGTYWTSESDSPKDNPHSRSEEHTSELQSPMRISYAVFSQKKKSTQPTPLPSTTPSNRTRPSGVSKTIAPAHESSTG